LFYLLFKGGRGALALNSIALSILLFSLPAEYEYYFTIYECKNPYRVNPGFVNWQQNWSFVKDKAVQK